MSRIGDYNPCSSVRSILDPTPEVHQADGCQLCAYYVGIQAGAAVAFGLMGMAEAIGARLWWCSHQPDHSGECQGRNFIPRAGEPWVCTTCGVREDAVDESKLRSFWWVAGVGLVSAP